MTIDTHVVVVRVAYGLARVRLTKVHVKSAPVADIVRARERVGELVQSSAATDVAGCHGSVGAEAGRRHLVVEDGAVAVPSSVSPGESPRWDVAHNVLDVGGGGQGVGNHVTIANPEWVGARERAGGRVLVGDGLGDRRGEPMPC